MVHTGGAIKKFFNASWCCFHFPVWTHCSLRLFSCVEFHFWLLSAVEKLYVSSRLWVWWNVCHNFFNFCIGKTFTSVSFFVHLQIVFTKNGFMPVHTCRKPFSSKQWPCGLSNSSDIRQILHNICICQHFLQKLGLFPVWAFMCIFKLLPLENVFAHSSHAEGLFQYVVTMCAFKFFRY